MPTSDEGLLEAIYESEGLVYPINLIFLYFKALLLNSEYKRLSELTKSNEFGSPFKKQYPYFERIYSFFGDISQYSSSANNESIREAFNIFFLERGPYFFLPNLKQVEFVEEGRTVSPEYGKLYIAMPHDTNIEFVTKKYVPLFIDSLKDWDKGIDEIYIPFCKTTMEETDKVFATAKRLDAHIWCNVEGLSPFAAVKKAYASTDNHWEELQNKIEHDVKKMGKIEKVKSSQLKSENDEMRRYSKEGAKVVGNVIEGKFPSCK